MLRGVAAVAAVVFLWCGFAAVRLHYAVLDFARSRPPESETFFASASLCNWNSLCPLIRKPFRGDIRLYFVHEPKFNVHGKDAWASNERGSWELKIHN